MTHVYDGVRTVNGLETDTRVSVPPGQRARVRVINTDNGPTSAWVTGAAARVLAVDGVDLNAPPPFEHASVLVTAGGRVDFGVSMPADGRPVRVQIGGNLGVVLATGSAGSPPTAARPDSTLDILSYGQPAPLPFDPNRADRTFAYDIGRRPGFVDGRPGYFWTINGHLFPDVPMFVVAKGNV